MSDAEEPSRKVRQWNSTLSANPAKGLKRTGFNRNSDKPASLARVNGKTRRVYAETSEQRAAFVASVWLCQCCGRRQATTCHEMTPGANRLKALYYRECQLALCDNDPVYGVLGCHPIVQYQPLSFQLWLKKTMDAEHYDRELVLRIKGWAMTAITEDEVDAWAEVWPSIVNASKSKAKKNR